MKKIALIISALTLCMTLTACGSDKPAESGSGSDLGSGSGSGSGSGTSGTLSDTNQLTDGVRITYDRSKYENISAPKCYYTDYQEIDDSFLLSFFSSEPEFDEATGMYIAGEEKGYNTYGGDKLGYYNLSYFTQTGNDFDTIGNHNYSKYSTTDELRFMSRKKLSEKLEEVLNSVVQTEIIFDAYAIGADDYIDNAATPSNDNLPPRPGNESYEKQWSEGADYYYIIGRQAVDNIPIFTGRVGNSNIGTASFGTNIKVVFTEKGLEYLWLYTPYKINGEFQTNDEFLTLEKAEGIIKSKFENLLAFQPLTLEEVELVYIPLHTKDGLILTPVWEFSDDFGPLYRINAYTGEEII